MPRKFIVSLLFLFSIQFAVAQNATDPKKAEDTEKLRKDAVEFLRETAQDVGRMRSPENRISFSAELASLMWFYDDKEAKAMYAATIGDFRQLLMQFDSQMNSFDVPSDEEGSYGIFGGYGRSPVERKFRIAMAVRQQIAMSVAEHEPEMAYNFFFDTASLISNEKFRKESEQSDKYFEFQLMKQIAETNAAKAVKFGTASLKDGVDGNHVDLLKKIYTKDADKGVEFGAAILSRVKSDKKGVKGLYVYSSLLSYGSENLDASQKSGGKKAIYSRSDLRDIADQFASALLDGSDEDAKYSALGFADQIEKFAPGRGAQIQAKYKSSNANSVTTVRSASNAASNSYSSGQSSTGMSANSNSAARSVDLEERDKAEKQMAEDLKNLGKPLPKEERDKIVASARKIISQTPGKEKKIGALSLLAAQVARAGDKELADEIMRDAEFLINPQPKNYKDFLNKWLVAGGYAEANPDKAFPILEDTIMRANETISAFVKVAEFIDVNEELVDDGEVQVGVFGGSMIRGLTRELGIADSTIIALAKADFAKTKGLTNSFDRIEIRVLAKMMVLRAVLDDKKPKNSGDVDIEMNAGDAPPPPMPTKPRPK